MIILTLLMHELFIEKHEHFAKKIKSCVIIIILLASSSHSAITAKTSACISPSPETEVNLNIV